MTLEIATRPRLLSEEMQAPRLAALAEGIRDYEQSGVCLLDMPVETIGLTMGTFVNPEPVISDVRVRWRDLNEEPPEGCTVEWYNRESFILGNLFGVDRRFCDVTGEADDEVILPQLREYGLKLAESFEQRYGALTPDMTIYQAEPMEIGRLGLDPRNGVRYNFYFEWIVKIGTAEGAA